MYWHFIGILTLGTLCSVVTFKGATWLYSKLKTPFANPLLVSAAILILLLLVTDIPLEEYESGTVAISFFLGPATVALAYSVYIQWNLLRENFIPICAGCLVGSLVSMTSAYFLCEALGLGDNLALSFVPKSVTMPIALTVTQQLGGTAAITVAAVIVTGILGAILSPMLVKIFRIKNPIATGIAIGTCSHAVGTTKAIEMGELEGAMSGVAIAVSGLLTTLIVVIARVCGGI
ncbi:LrgB family protein [Actinobacillus delphinicola]|uniref:Putative effector of murein hydrolase n=1 Tax=Actinobacillus delphinicola TaxID=51161 RepID=A0A448TW01_9PAST|nr:LrgB family protein [Actinobacillus delphinicola]VEJ10107.1 putative effector of murein hydrolase [Actinobacillus delphinicola]